MLPNFIIVGAPKAGTTAISKYLEEHPEVYFSDPKEVNFFSRESLELQGLYYNDFKVRDIQQYEELFKNVVDQIAIGEGSVSYLFYPEVPFNIKEAIPESKIIILLRNPVDRAFSHYLMDYRLGLVKQSFEDIFYKNSTDSKVELYYQQYIELGLYYEQVKRYLDCFRLDQVKIYLQEDLKVNTLEIVQELYEFLGVDQSFVPDISRKHNVFQMPKGHISRFLYSSQRFRNIAKLLFNEELKRKIKNRFFDSSNKPSLASDLRRELTQLYRPDVEKLEKLINRDLSGWYVEK